MDSIQKPTVVSTDYLKLREGIKSYVEANSFDFDAAIDNIDKENEDKDKIIDEERKKYKELY